jgi:curved DNA-binding protein CbpA
MIKKFVSYSSKIYKLKSKSISFKRIEVIERNYYQTLGVGYDADYEEIKKNYYVLAKKYHPDLNPSPDAVENFKKIKRAYEVLGDPNLRISYDLENNLTDANNTEIRRESDQRFTNKYGKRVMRGPKTIKNFYWDKWGEFKTPTWSNLKSGMDYRAEYMMRQGEEEIDEPYAYSAFRKKIIKYRVLIYLITIFALDIFIIADNCKLYKTYLMFKTTFFKY